jgi:hypothetical protein
VDQKYWNEGSDGQLKDPGLKKAGSLLHRKDGKFLIQRTSHGSPSRLLPYVSMEEYRDVMKAKGPELSHQESFVQACMGNGTTTSPFSVGAELTQVLTLGVIAQYLNESFDFDPVSKRVTNHPTADALVQGPAPRKGWEGYYTSV